MTKKVYFGIFWGRIRGSHGRKKVILIHAGFLSSFLGTFYYNKMLLYFVLCLFLTVPYSQSAFTLGDIGKPSQKDFPKNQVYDFGFVREGEIVKHTFDILNRSSNSIKISKTSFGCSCIAPKVIPIEIAPLSSWKLPIEINTSGLNGPYTKKIIIEMDKQNVVYSLQGTIIREHPKYIDFGKLKRGDIVLKSFVLKSIPNYNYLIKELRYNEKYFDISFSEEREHTFKFNVKIKANISFGSFSESLIISTNDKVIPKKIIKLEGYVFKRMETDTQKVIFGNITNKQKVEQIKVYSPYGENISISEVVSSDPENIKAKVVKNSPDGKLILFEIIFKDSPTFKYQFICKKLSIIGKVGANSETVDIMIFAIKEKD